MSSATSCQNASSSPSATGSTKPTDALESIASSSSAQSSAIAARSAAADSASMVTADAGTSSAMAGAPSAGACRFVIALSSHIPDSGPPRSATRARPAYPRWILSAASRLARRMSADNPQRCAWAQSDPLLRAYHDHEWGVPEHDSRALWEKLMLDGFQAGLSWLTVLRKRDAFRNAFRGFDPAIVARFTAADVERRCGHHPLARQDPGDHRQRPRLSGDAGQRRGLRRIRVGAGRRQDDRGQRPRAREDAAVRGDVGRTEGAWIQVRRPCDRLRVDAGGGHRRRPCARLLSAPCLEAAPVSYTH